LTGRTKEEEKGMLMEVGRRREDAGCKMILWGQGRGIL
jgi:hypothetical protein